MGTDLRVVLGPLGMGAADSSPLDLRLGPGTAERARDGLAVIAGRENLAQALILRLLTPRGALADLGHASYGSRLHEVIGRHRDETSRALCKAFVLDAIAQEPRVHPKAVAFAFDPLSEGPSELRFAVTVTPIDGSGPLTVSLEAQL